MVLLGRKAGAISAFALLALAAPVSSQSSGQSNAPVDPDATAQGDVSVTIYKNGQALVQDIRQLDMQPGVAGSNLLMCRRRSGPKRSVSPRQVPVLSSRISTSTC